MKALAISIAVLMLCGFAAPTTAEADEEQHLLLLQSVITFYRAFQAGDGKAIHGIFSSGYRQQVSEEEVINRAAKVKNERPLVMWVLRSIFEEEVAGSRRGQSFAITVHMIRAPDGKLFCRALSHDLKWVWEGTAWHIEGYRVHNPNNVPCIETRL